MDHLSVEVKDSPFDLDDESSRVIRTRNPKTDLPLYQVFLYLDGPDLPFVESVIYELHSTFPDPVRRVQRSVSNPRCKLPIWTWGVFEVKATIVDKSGRSHPRLHQLEYDGQFSREGVRFLAS